MSDNLDDVMRVELLLEDTLLEAALEDYKEAELLEYQAKRRVSDAKHTLARVMNGAVEVSESDPILDAKEQIKAEAERKKVGGVGCLSVLVFLFILVDCDAPTTAETEKVGLVQKVRSTSISVFLMGRQP